MDKNTCFFINPSLNDRRNRTLSLEILNKQSHWTWANQIYTKVSWIWYSLHYSTLGLFYRWQMITSNDSRSRMMGKTNIEADKLAEIASRWWSEHFTQLPPILANCLIEPPNWVTVHSCNKYLTKLLENIKEH